MQIDIFSARAIVSADLSTITLKYISSEEDKEEKELTINLPNGDFDATDLSILIEGTY